ncbi:hypothetical protein KFK09_015691 [Dendrobium nobile]|uniref:Uncharacterized protein n=1 Tax=Dendrobium nobile TaxID=94219 RepID=A0A8T3B6Q6_DENNO|nr:hypothetical protein KFK09_015691 [Dendrobium nobile]
MEVINVRIKVKSVRFWLCLSAIDFDGFVDNDEEAPSFPSLTWLVGNRGGVVGHEGGASNVGSLVNLTGVNQVLSSPLGSSHSAPLVGVRHCDSNLKASFSYVDALPLLIELSGEVDSRVTDLGVMFASELKSKVAKSVKNSVLVQNDRLILSDSFSLDGRKMRFLANVRWLSQLSLLTLVDLMEVINVRIKVKSVRFWLCLSAIDFDGFVDNDEEAPSFPSLTWLVGNRGGVVGHEGGASNVGSLVNLTGVNQVLSSPLGSSHSAPLVGVRHCDSNLKASFSYVDALPLLIELSGEVDSRVTDLGVMFASELKSKVAKSVKNSVLVQNDRLILSDSFSLDGEEDEVFGESIDFDGFVDNDEEAPSFPSLTWLVGNRDCTRGFFSSFGAVRLRSFDDFPLLSDRKLRYFDRKQERELAGCEAAAAELFYGFFLSLFLHRVPGNASR